MRPEPIDAWRVRQALDRAQRHLEDLLRLYEGQDEPLPWAEQDELIQSGVAYPDPTSRSGVALATWVRALMEEVGERKGRVLRASGLEELLRREYLELLEEGARLSERGELELARRYLARSLRVSGDLRTYTRRFESQIAEAQEDLRGLSPERLSFHLKRLTELYRRFVEEFERAIFALGAGGSRKDLPLLERLAQNLGAPEARGAWQEVARTLEVLHKEVRGHLERLDQKRAEAERRRKAFWRGVHLALQKGLWEFLGEGLVSLTPYPLPERENASFARQVARRVGFSPRKEREVLLGALDLPWEEEEEEEGQKLIDQFLAQEEETSFYAWAKTRDWEGSARSLLALSLLMDIDLEGIIEAKEEGGRVVDVVKRCENP